MHCNINGLAISFCDPTELGCTIPYQWESSFIKIGKASSCHDHDKVKYNASLMKIG